MMGWENKIEIIEKVNYIKKGSEIATVPHNNKLQYSTFGQLISRARMEKKPLIVVEGKEDIHIYEQFAKKVNKNVRVRAVETFPEYSEGCKQVKKFIEDAQDEISKNEENKKFILGIVDRDATYFRNELPELECLFVLRAYSFESHFVTRNNLEYALENYLNSNFGITNKIIDYIMNEFYKSLSIFYYFSLEALKNACVKDYSGVVRFKMSHGHLKNVDDLTEDIMAKKDELDQFASGLNIRFSDAQIIIKGKWLLDHFIENTLKSISKLSDNCISNSLIDGQERCTFCQNEITDKCSWKPKRGYNINTYRGFIFQYHEVSEVEYIYEKFRRLG